IGQVLRGVRIIMVVMLVNAHRFLAELMSPYFENGRIIVLNPGGTGGALGIRQVFREQEVKTKVIVAETQTFLFASCISGPDQTQIFRIKNSIPVAAIPAYKTVEVVQILLKALPQFVPEDSVPKTSFSNIGAVFHPTLTVLNAARIESTRGEFDSYLKGITPSVVLVLETVDREKVQVAEALGVRVNTAREWLYYAYDALGRDLYEAIQSNPGYKGIRVSVTLFTRSIAEDVPMSLVPISSFGKMLGVATPTINIFTHLANLMHGRDYVVEGRTVEKLEVVEMGVKEIWEIVVNGRCEGGE
ncbi:MAG: NAD/NADP octopine/nopaline dehydrogenase family protein, partial [Atribacterota bacterium]|nr:NAD/NADP octopine/nopaline dehydrogenase family protein [Atribacterota bacterium]